MAKRIDRDGVRLERYTKAHKMIPVGSHVAVQNQAGRFPNKWDKTGMVVENLDHDKVLVKLDGSGRLTTRNRKFVKKIVSAPDKPVDVLPVMRKSLDVREDDKVEFVPNVESDGDLILPEDEDHLQVQGPSVGHEVMDGWDAVGVSEPALSEDVVPEAPAVVPVPTPSTQPADGRPVRARKPNVRYSKDEYDLSEISMSGRVCQGRVRGRNKCKRGMKL